MYTYMERGREAERQTTRRIPTYILNGLVMAEIFS